MPSRRFTLPALVLSAAIALAGCGSDTEDSQQSAGNRHQADQGDQGDRSQRSKSEASPADVRFAQMMIPHHAQAVEMAEMVPKQGVSKELMQLADDIDAGQQPEIEQLIQMLRQWDAEVPATGAGQSGSRSGHGADSGHEGHVGSGEVESDRPEHEMEGMMSEQDMESLDEATGREFERMWLTMMVEHHQGAVHMAETVLDKGDDTEAKKLAREIIDAQDDEIGQMNRMLDKLES